MSKSEEHIDIKGLVNVLLTNKYYFIATFLVAFGLAWLYMQVISPVYEVGTTIQLKDSGLTGKKQGPESIIDGFELFASEDELENEIGLLSSFSTVKSAIEQLNFQVSYYQYNNFLGKLGATFGSEFVADSFQVVLSYTAPQVLNTPIYISFPTDSTYRVEVSNEEVDLYTVEADKVIGIADEVVIDAEVQANQAFVSDYLNLTLLVGEAVDRDKGYYVTVKSIDKLTKQYRKKLNVSPISKESDIVSVTTTGSIPKKEAKFLNQLTAVYIDQDVQKKNQLGIKTISFIDQQLANIADSLRRVEGNLESFRARNRIVDISTTSESLTKQLEELERRKAEHAVRNEYLKFLVDHLNSSSVSEIAILNSPGINDPVLSNLIIELARLNQDKATLKYHSTNSNPALEIVETKIAATRTSLVHNLDNQIKSSTIALRQVDREIRDIEQSVSRLPANERNLIDIERRFAFSDNIYNYLLEKRAEVGIAIASNVAVKSVVDDARPLEDDPISPKGWVVYGLALVLGSILPLGLIVFQEFWNDTIVQQKELQQIADVPIIGSVANGTKRSQLVIEKNPHSTAAESFRFVRINLQYYYRDVKHPIVGITSSVEGEGKTYCSANLAAELAQSGNRTLLVGCDLRRPKLDNYLPVRKPGIVECLNNQKPLSNGVQNTRLANLDVLPAGSAVKNSFDYLENHSFQSFLKEAASNYEYIIVDTPPINFAVDYFMLQEIFDITLLVVRQHYTHKEVVERSLETLQKNSIRHLAMLFNDVKSTKGYSAYHSGEANDFSRI